MLAHFKNGCDFQILFPSYRVHNDIKCNIEKIKINVIFLLRVDDMDFHSIEIIHAESGGSLYILTITIQVIWVKEK